MIHAFSETNASLASGYTRPRWEEARMIAVARGLFGACPGTS